MFKKKLWAFYFVLMSNHTMIYFIGITLMTNESLGLAGSYKQTNKKIQI